MWGKTMIDVERLQKLNQLASDLLEHGFAEDREDALRQADNTLKKETQSVSILRMNDPPPMVGEKKEPEPEVAQADDPEPAPAQSYEPDWNMLYRNLNKKIDDQNAAIGALREQISILQNNVTELKNAPPKVVVQAPPAAQPAPVAAPQGTAPAAPVAQPAAPAPAQASSAIINAATGETLHVTPDKQATSRSGNYSSEDVSVEKIFYSGSRPQA